VACTEGHGLGTVADEEGREEMSRRAAFWMFVGLCLAACAASFVCTAASLHTFGIAAAFMAGGFQAHAWYEWSGRDIT